MTDVELGVQWVADSPNLTFIFFLALALLGALGLRFAVYAHLNDRAAGRLAADHPWRLLTLAGLSAVLFALLGVVDVVSTVRTPYRQGVWLAHVLALGLALRRLSGVAARDPASDGTGGRSRPVWLLGGVAVLGVSVGSLWAPDGVAVTALEGASAVAFAALGLYFAHRATSAVRVQGTVADSLVRHLQPVLLFSALVPIADLAVLGDLPRVVVLHVQVVFLIMSATALMTATIKLRQRVATL